MALHSEDMRIDCRETPKAYVFAAELPGLSKKEVKVEVVDGRILQISGERKEEEELGDQKETTWHCRERSSGPFLRRLRLPEDADADLAKAKMENGVLTLTVPKAAAELRKPKGRAVEISDGGEKKAAAARRKKGMLCCGLAV